MKFYPFKESIDLDEVGTYPQVWELLPTYDEEAYDSIYYFNYKEIRYKPKGKPNCDGFLLDWKSKVTDILSVVPVRGVFISEKLKDILSEHQLPSKHVFWEVGLYRSREKLSGFYWLMVEEIGVFDILFDKSTFYKKGSDTTTANTIRIHSFQEYEQKEFELENRDDDFVNQGTYYSVGIESLVLDKRWENYDLFYVDFNGMNQYFISERLKEIFKENGITGYDIGNLPNISFE